MLDNDLSQLYGVQTKRLEEQVRRNPERFPEHFMFELTVNEYAALRSQNATLKRGEHSKYLPLVFTEHGILMLSNVLKSKSAIEISIRIIDVFVNLRSVYLEQREVWMAIENMRAKLHNQDKSIEIVFQYLDELLQNKHIPEPRKRIGYMPDGE